MIKALALALLMAAAGPRAALAEGWSNMPITAIAAAAAAPGGDTFAVFYSGDAGWGGAPKEVSAALAQAGVPVVGVDSLKYYWRRRSPDGAADDLGQLIAHYARAWSRPNVVLVGYSFGADALPMLLARLPADLKGRVRALALISPAYRAHLAFRFASWFDIPLPGGFPVAPALSADAPTPVLCVQAVDDPRAACRDFPPGLAQTVVLPGGHRYRGERDRLAALILKAAGSQPPFGS